MKTQRSIRRLAARNGVTLRCNRSERIWFLVDAETNSFVSEHTTLAEVQELLTRV